jgi:hypothetical protein
MVFIGKNYRRVTAVAHISSQAIDERKAMGIVHLHKKNGVQFMPIVQVLAEVYTSTPVCAKNRRDAVMACPHQPTIATKKSAYGPIYLFDVSS